MECGKLTAKLRDAVPVCFIVDGKEVKRLKNIEIPNEIKKLPFTAFKFDVPQNGAITFKLMFEASVLPDEWPEPRQRKTRGSKAAGQPIDIAPEAEAALEAEKSTEVEDTETVTEEPVPEEIAYNITGDRRKALVEAIANYTGEKAIYQNAPSFAYHIGPFAVDKNGTLSGPIDHSLIRWLADEGFTVEE